MKMKTLLIVPLLFTALISRAQKTYELSFDLGAFSEYNWRQETLNEKTISQGQVSLATEKGLTVGAWFNNLIHPDYSNKMGDFNEVDLFIAYSKTKGKLNGEIGAIEYVFPTGDLGTREVYGTITYDAEHVSPYVSLFYDIDRADGIYLETGVGATRYGVDFSSLISYSNAEYNEAYHGVDESNLHGYSFGASKDFSITEAVTATASVNYSGLLSFGKDSGNLFGGISFNFLM